MRSFRLFTALLGLVLISFAGCGSDQDSFVFTNSNINQGGLTLQVAADPAALRGIHGRFQPAVTQIRVTVFDFRLVQVGQQTVPRTGVAVFNNLPAGTYYILMEGLLSGGTVVGSFGKKVQLNSNQTELIPGLKISNTPPPPPTLEDFEDPTPFLIFTAVPDPVVSGTPFSITAQVFNGDGSPVTAAVSGVTLVSNNTAFVANPSPQTTNSSGVVTFQNLNYPANTTGTAELIVDASGVDSAASGTIQINAAANPRFLQFTSVPSEVAAGATFSVTAQVFNADNSPVSSPVSGVSLVANGVPFDTNPANQTTDSNGIVTFSNLSFPTNASGTATLTVNADDVSSATSANITVTMNAANGFIGLVNQQDVNELGEADVTPDGRFVAYSDSAIQVSPDSNSTNDVFVLDRQNNTVERVSVDDTGAEANGPSSAPSISSDGRFVAFHSGASNLVAGDNNDETDIFVYDRTNDTVEIVSVDSAENIGNQRSINPSISGDGRFVVFQSEATNLVTGDTAREDIFLRDRTAGTTVRISVNPMPGEGNGQGNGDSSEPVISTNGDFVVFSSFASNFVSGDTAVQDIFLYNRANNTMEKISFASGGGNLTFGSAFGPDISSDGRFVSFSHGSNELVAGDTNDEGDVFVRDRQNSTTERVSLTVGSLEANGTSFDSSISDDGRYVLFASRATNIVAGDSNSEDDIFLRDRDSGSTSLVTVAPGQTTPVGGSGPVISGDGGTIVFETRGALVLEDMDAAPDLYVVSNPPPTP